MTAANSLNRSVMTNVENTPKEYSLSIRTSDVHEAVSSVASALYTLIEEALAAHEQHVAEECDFEIFARDLLGILMRHGDMLSADTVSWEDDERADGELVS